MKCAVPPSLLLHHRHSDNSLHYRCDFINNCASPTCPGRREMKTWELYAGPPYANDSSAANGHAVGKRTMADCNPEQQQQRADKLCKYSYASWCPTCDRESPRRRTKSESWEVCRRKGRELKTFTPKKYDRRCEYENHQQQQQQQLLLLDVDMADYDAHGTARYDRVRSNLCELPTTYITNNCQLNFSHAKPAPPSAHAEYLDAKIPRDYENSYTVNCDCSSPPATTRCCEVMSDHRYKRLPQPQPPLRRVGGPSLPHPPTTRMPAPHGVVTIDAPPLSSPPPRSPTTAALSHTMPRLFRNDGRYPAPNGRDTCTFFDKHFDAKQVRERYTRELEILREKLKDLHNHKYSPIKPPATIKNLDRNPRRNTTNVKLEDITVIEDVAVPKIDGSGRYRVAASLPMPTPTPPLNPVPNPPNPPPRQPRAKEIKASNKITVKATKSRLASARSSKVKFRSFKTPAPAPAPAMPAVAMSVSSSSSEPSDAEASPSASPKSPCNDFFSEAASGALRVDAAKATGPVRTKECGDAPIWPVRYSLFPNIPPYLKFSMHDDEPNKLPSGRRYMKWKLSTITPIVVRKTLVNTGFRLVRITEADVDDVKKSNDWTGTWGKHMKSPLFKTLKSNQKLNHFAGTFQLGRKDRLWKNVQRLMHRFGNKEFGFIPQTFVLPHDLKALKQCWECKDGSAGEKWIIKPPASARGVGIRVINKWSQLPKQGAVIVQKYIADPYLINGSKFDLRLYVLVTSFNPLRIYMYPEGLVRFASVKYSDNDKDLKDRFMHLTNYSINKLSSQYTANEDANSCNGHKWTLTKLWEYMSDRGIDTKYLWSSLKQLVIKTMVSGESPITQLCNENVVNRYNCYELFGVDVLFDERLKPWLLEVNISPSLHSTSPLDLHVKGPLVQTLFNIAQFHLPPRVSRSCETAPACYDARLYSVTLTPKEANKHNYFMQMEKRSDYLAEILDQLTGDDVRILTQAEDEFVVKGRFERIFPTATSYRFLEYIPVRYYNRLFDAWEARYEKHRDDGIQRLKVLCSKRVHLKVQPQPASAKNSQHMIPGAGTTPNEKQPPAPTPPTPAPAPPAANMPLPPTELPVKTEVPSSAQALSH